jgi:hypothetical protein
MELRAQSAAATDVKLLTASLLELEREFVLEALQRNDWNVTKAAQDADIQLPNFTDLFLWNP